MTELTPSDLLLSPNIDLQLSLSILCFQLVSHRLVRNPCECNCISLLYKVTNQSAKYQIPHCTSAIHNPLILILQTLCPLTYGHAALVPSTVAYSTPRILRAAATPPWIATIWICLRPRTIAASRMHLIHRSSSIGHP